MENQILNIGKSRSSVHWVFLVQIIPLLLKKYTFYNMMVRGRAGDFFIQQNVLLFFFVLGQGVLCFNQIGATKKVIVISGTFKPLT